MSSKGLLILGLTNAHRQKIKYVYTYAIAVEVCIFVYLLEIKYASN